MYIYIYTYSIIAHIHAPYLYLRAALEVFESLKNCTWIQLHVASGKAESDPLPEPLDSA